MMKNYDESVEKIHNPNWPYILAILTEFQLLVVQGQAKLMCYCNE